MQEKKTKTDYTKQICKYAEGARIEAPMGVRIGEGCPGRKRIFDICEAHRTLLVERTVLPRSNKTSFFP